MWSLKVVVTVLLLVGLCQAAVKLAANTDIAGCKPAYKEMVDHTMCIYQPMACSENYTMMAFKPFSKAEQKKMVKIHNDLRKQLTKGTVAGQPKAKKMPPMVWNQELASIAQRAAEQCNFEHDKNRNVGSKDSDMVGQNIAQQSFSPVDVANNIANITLAAMSWWNEVYDPGFTGTVDPYSPGAKQAGHYSQMAWAASNKIGCGFVVYKDKVGDTMYTDIFCNYQVAGNMVGGTMYAKAKA